MEPPLLPQSRSSTTTKKPGLDSAQALGLQNRRLKIEVLLPNKAVQAFVLPAPFTILQIKRSLWNSLSFLTTYTITEFTIIWGDIKLADDVRLKKAHPIINQLFRDGKIIKLELINGKVPAPAAQWRSGVAPARKITTAQPLNNSNTIVLPVKPIDGTDLLNINIPAIEIINSPEQAQKLEEKRKTILLSIHPIQSKGELIIPCEGFYIDNGMELPFDPFGSNNLAIEDLQQDIAYYNEHFVCADHTNFIGEHENVGPIAVSIAERAEDHNYRAIIWTKSGDERLFISDKFFKGTLRKDNLTKQIMNAVKKLQPSIERVNLHLTRSPEFAKQLAEMESRQIVTNYKFGILMAKHGQVNEEDMFSNEYGSEAFEEFLDFLGDRIQLQGWTEYRGGLDVKKNSTGTHSVYTKWKNYEIIYHVSTFLPYSTHDRQQLERKRHIGNDIVVIIFMDGDTPYSPLTISSEFNHVWFVVQPIKQPGLPTRYKLSVAAKEGVRPWKPLIPYPAIFEKTPQTREFFLTKLINAERAAYHATAFGAKITRTRAALLKNLIQEFGNA